MHASEATSRSESFLPSPELHAAPIISATFVDSKQASMYLVRAGKGLQTPRRRLNRAQLPRHWNASFAFLALEQHYFLLDHSMLWLSAFARRVEVKSLPPL